LFLKMCATKIVKTATFDGAAWSAGERLEPPSPIRRPD